jgi:hypothetical protein
VLSDSDDVALEAERGGVLKCGSASTLFGVRDALTAAGRFLCCLTFLELLEIIIFGAS